MPWLVATALLHSVMATERTGAFRSWTLLLAIAAFSFSLIGTFLVRSGVLTSVHAFANDPERGIFILHDPGVAIGGALALFAWRAPSLDSRRAFEPVSRETALLLNNVLLTAAAPTVFSARSIRCSRCARRREDFRGPALFRHHLRADLGGAAPSRAVRPALALAPRPI